jgi:hypothetical protein
MKTISNNNYSLEIPNNWEIEYSKKGTLSIFSPDGKGAIIVSSFTSESNTPIAAESLEIK